MTVVWSPPAGVDSVCGDAGGIFARDGQAVRSPCGCGGVPSGQCCTPDAQGRILTLHLPAGAAQSVYLSGSFSGLLTASSNNGTTTASLIVNFNRLPLDPGQGEPDQCDNAWSTDESFLSSDETGGAIAVAGAYSNTATGEAGGVASWSMAIQASRSAELWDQSSPPDAIQTALQLLLTVNVVYGLDSGGSVSRDFNLLITVAEDPCDPLAVDECVQSFDVSPLGLSVTPCAPGGGSAFVVATPLGGVDPRLSAFDAGRWDISAQLSNSVDGGQNGTDFSVSAQADLRTEREWTLPGDPATYTAWATCPAWADAIASCQATGTTCCESGDCGKESASFPFRWRRVLDAGARLVDRTVALDDVRAYLVSSAGVDDQQDSTAGDCAISETIALLTAGGAAAPDQFGVNRLLAMSGATIGGVAYGARVRITPDPAPGLGKRFRFVATLPILWTRSGQTPHPIGVLEIDGTTVDGAGVSTLLTIDTAEFRWNTVAQGSLGVMFEPGESRPAAEPLVNGTGFDLVGTPTGPGCYRQFQLVPRTDPFAPTGPLVVQTDRTLRTVDGQNLSQPRNLLIEIDLQAFIQIINIAACPSAPQASQIGGLQPNLVCKQCQGPIVGGVCLSCGQPASRRCAGCG